MNVQFTNIEECAKSYYNNAEQTFFCVQEWEKFHGNHLLPSSIIESPEQDFGKQWNDICSVQNKAKFVLTNTVPVNLAQKSPHGDDVDMLTNQIVQDLLAEGLSMDDIIMPGGGKGAIIYVSPDFDEPLAEFADYL